MIKNINKVINNHLKNPKPNVTFHENDTTS